MVRKRGWPTWMVVAGFCVVGVVLCLFFVTSYLHFQRQEIPWHANRRSVVLDVRKQPTSQVSPTVPVPEAKRLHVVFSTDDTDLRALVVAIKTAVSASSEPSRLFFHIVTSPELAALFDSLLHIHLQGVQLHIHHNVDLQGKIAASIPVRTTLTAARQALAGPFNFAMFYLADFWSAESDQSGISKARKILYLDTDVVFHGDLIQLFEVELKQEAVMAAVKDCSQRFEDFFNLPEVQKYGSFAPRSCIFQKGVVLMDLVRWKERRYAAKIEEWLVRYRDSEDALWYDGLAQPPWLLVLNGSVQELDPKWNCFNLGRPTMSFEEGAPVRRVFDHKALLYDLSMAINQKYGTMKPYMASCTTSANVLHFSGELKPWLADAWSARTPAPVCKVSPDLQLDQMESWWTNLSDTRVRFVKCTELWMRHLTKEEECSLKDIEKEWWEEEQLWHDQWRVQKKRRDQELQRKEEESKAKEAAALEGLKSKEEDEERKKEAKDKPTEITDADAAAGTEAAEADATVDGDVFADSSVPTLSIASELAANSEP